MSQSLIGGSSSQSGLPGGFTKQLQGNLSSLMGQDKSQGFGALTLNPDVSTTQVPAEWEKLLDPNFLNVYQDPTFQQFMKQAGLASQQNLKTSEAGLASRFGGAGGLRGSPFMQSAQEAAVQSNQNLDQILSGQAMNLLGQRTSMIPGAIQGLSQSNLLSAWLIQMLGPLLQKGKSVSSAGILQPVTTGAAVGAGIAAQGK